MTTKITSLDIPFVRRIGGPLALILVTPLMVLGLWLLVFRYDSSLARFVDGLSFARFLSELPRPTGFAAAVIGFWAVFQLLLLKFMPGAAFLGPITASGARPEYKRNGVICWVVTHVLLVAGLASGVLSGRTFFAHFGEILVTLTVAAFALCVVLYLKGVYAPNSPDCVRTGNVIFDFFQGIELHPRAFGASVKQWVNCRISMMGWSAIVVLCMAQQYETLGHVTPALTASSVLLIAYLFKFFLWETGYFTSLDIMHDRFGYYICWGVCVWVPAVYPISQLYLIAHPVDTSVWLSAAIVVFGLTSIWMNYAADVQRQKTRASQGTAKIWGRAPVLIKARYITSDGVERENLLLASGYWGLARHFHYVPEIALALSWALPAGFANPVPYFYVVYLTILLTDRASRDDKRCASKYGQYWEQYRKLVPYKIIPKLY